VQTWVTGISDIQHIAAIFSLVITICQLIFHHMSVPENPVRMKQLP